MVLLFFIRSVHNPSAVRGPMRSGSAFSSISTSADLRTDTLFLSKMMTHPLSANCPIDRSGLWRPFTRWATRAAGGRFLIGRRPLDVPWMRVELAVMMLTPIGVVSSSSSGTVLSTRCRVHALSAARNESEARFDTCTVRSSSSSRNKVLNELLLIRLLVEIA